MDFNNPTLTTNYSDFLANLKSRDEAIMSMLNGSHTNVPTNSVRYERTAKKFQNYNGTSWDDLTIDGSTLVAASVATAALAANAVDDTKIRLPNNLYLRGRNVANNADLSVLKVDDGDSTWLNWATSKSLVLSENNTAKIVFNNNVFYPWVDSTVELGTSAKRWAKTWSDAFEGDSLKSTSGTALTIGTLGAQDVVFRTSDTNKWKIVSGGHWEPETNETYDIGSSTKRVNKFHVKYINDSGTVELHIGNVNSSTYLKGAIYPISNLGNALGWTTNAFSHCFAEIMSSPNSYDLRLRAPSTKGILFQPNDGGTVWSINSSGHLYPASDNTYRIGTGGQQCSWVYTTQLNSNGRDLSYDVLGATTYKHQFRVDANNVFAIGHTGSYGRVNFQNHQTAGSAGSLWNYLIIQVDGTNYKIPVYNV